MTASTPRRQGPKGTRHINEGAKRPTIRASEVGVTLTISAEALKKIEAVEAMAIKAAVEGREFYWR